MCYFHIVLCWSALDIAGHCWAGAGSIFAFPSSLNYLDFAEGRSTIVILAWGTGLESLSWGPIETLCYISQMRGVAPMS